MPIGIIVNCLAVFAGGAIGALIGPVLPERIKEDLNKTFGFVALVLGVILVTKTNNLGAVALAVITGMLIGSLLNINDHMNSAIIKLNKKIVGKGFKSPEVADKLGLLVVIFAFGCTTLIGPVMALKDGDNSMMLTKAVMDFFTAIIFGSILGFSVSLIAIPQFLMYSICLLCARFIIRFLSRGAYGDFEGVGGIISLFAGMKLIGACDIKASNALLAMVLVILFYYMAKHLLIFCCLCN